MAECESSLPEAAAISEDLVAHLGELAGLHLAPERLPLIAQRLRDLHIVAAELDSLDLERVDPAIRFDPSWPGGGAT